MNKFVGKMLAYRVTTCVCLYGYLNLHSVKGIYLLYAYRLTISRRQSARWNKF